MFIANFYRNDEKDIFDFEKFNIYEYSKDAFINSEVYTEDHQDEIIQNSYEIFEKLEKNKNDDQSYIEMYRYLIRFNPIVPQPNENVLNIILHHAINIQTPELASLAIEFLSYHAKQIPSIENFIFENLDKKLLHQYFNGSLFNENIYHYLNEFLKFTSNTINFCIENNFYSDLTMDHEYVDDSVANDLTFNILLIQTALISFPKNSNYIQYDIFYNYLITKIHSALLLQNQRTQIMHPLCFSICLCLFKMPNEMTQMCIPELFRNSYFDALYSAWEDQINDEYCVHINECIAYCVYLASGFVPDQMIQKLIYKTISKRILNLSHYQGQYSKDINEIISLLIEGIIFCVETNSSLWRNLFEEHIIETSPNEITFGSMMFSLFDDSYVLKNMSARFFIATLNIEECQPYLVRYQVIQRLIEYFDESNSKDLLFLLRKLDEISDKIMATENYQENPLFKCIQTAECYDSLKHISIENEEDEFRVLASELLEKIFGESNDS